MEMLDTAISTMKTTSTIELKNTAEITTALITSMSNLTIVVTRADISLTTTQRDVMVAVEATMLKSDTIEAQETIDMVDNLHLNVKTITAKNIIAVSIRIDVMMTTTIDTAMAMKATGMVIATTQRMRLLRGLLE